MKDMTEEDFLKDKIIRKLSMFKETRVNSYLQKALSLLPENLPVNTDPNGFKEWIEDNKRC